MNYCSFNIEPFCSDVCGDHRRPQTLAEICRNMGICCGFRAVAARGKYPGFILLLAAYVCTWFTFCCVSLCGTAWFHPYPSIQDYFMNTDLFLWFPWWGHQMETFSTSLAICVENSPVTGEFLAQRPVTWSFDVFFDLRLNIRLSKQSWGWWFETPSRPLWHCNVPTACEATLTNMYKLIKCNHY